MEAEDIKILQNNIFGILDNTLKLSNGFFHSEGISVDYDSKEKATEQILENLNVKKAFTMLITVEAFLTGGGVLKEGRDLFTSHDRDGYCTYNKYDKKQKRHLITQYVEDIGYRILRYDENDFISCFYVEINVLPIFQ